MSAVVLIIDRDSVTAGRSKSVLASAGYEVLLCPTDGEAREAMRNRHVDAVVVMANVEHESELDVIKWHEEFCANAVYFKTNEDAQHLADHINRELGDYNY